LWFFFFKRTDGQRFFLKKEARTFTWLAAAQAAS
jgi:hypothetical protein